MFDSATHQQPFLQRRYLDREIGYQTRGLLACSAVPQPTAPSPTPLCKSEYTEVWTWEGLIHIYYSDYFIVANYMLTLEEIRQVLRNIFQRFCTNGFIFFLPKMLMCLCNSRLVPRMCIRNRSAFLIEIFLDFSQYFETNACVIPWNRPRLPLNVYLPQILILHNSISLDAVYRIPPVMKWQDALRN